MVKAIFWDMDGTMVDSEPAWGTATYELSELMGRRLSPQLRELTVGGSFPRTLEICADYAGVSLKDSDYEHYREIMFARMNELFDATLTPNPGVVEILQDFFAEQTPMLVTTNTERSLADRAIAAVGEKYFVGSITGDEVQHPKPAPDMYIEAASRVGFEPHQCLVFEDSFNGMSAAVDAGCQVIGLNPIEVSPPEGVVTLRELSGTNSFAGVSSSMIRQWFHEIAPATLR